MELIKNEGTADRVIRVIVGVVLLAAALTGHGTPWTWIGIIPLLTGIIGICPLYYLLGINTCKNKVIAGGD